MLLPTRQVDRALLDRIRGKHNRLFDERLFEKEPQRGENTRGEIRTDPRTRTEFTKEVDELIQEIQEAAKQTDSLDDYTYLTGLAQQWQRMLPRLNISKVIEMPIPEVPLRSSVPARGSLPLTDDDVERWLKDKAYAISKDRRQRALDRLKELFAQPNAIETVTRHPASIVGLLGIGRDTDDAVQDWLAANTSFAAAVLDGSIDLVHELTTESYPRLEREWLDDVKRFWAYLIWEETGGTLDRLDAYYSACDRLYGQLQSDEIKRDVSEFAPFLETLCHDSKKRRSLTAYKAEHLYQRTNTPDAKANWFRAEGYVNRFYGNIQRAVDGNAQSLRRILLTTGPHAPAEDQCLVNSLEMAIAIYFLPPAATRNALQSVADRAPEV